LSADSYFENPETLVHVGTSRNTCERGTRKHETKQSLFKMWLYKEKNNGSDTNCMIPCIKYSTLKELEVDD
jgi:hypothetical protein